VAVGGSDRVARCVAFVCVATACVAYSVAGCGPSRAVNSAVPSRTVERPVRPEPEAPVSEVPSESDVSPPRADPPAEPRIVIRKADHLLEVYRGDALVKACPVGLGAAEDGTSTSEAGPKVRRGDRKTPEGLYHIRERHDAGRFYHWMGLDYPNEEDAEHGLRDGLIGERERDRVVAAVRAGRLPPMDTKLGGDIGIHGGGSGSDWTLGCIAVENSDADELWELAPVGTPVELLP